MIVLSPICSIPTLQVRQISNLTLSLKENIYKRETEEGGQGAFCTFEGKGVHPCSHLNAYSLRNLHQECNFFVIHAHAFEKQRNPCSPFIVLIEDQKELVYTLTSIISY